MKNSRKIFENNSFVIGLFALGSFLAIISVLGYIFNPSLFSSFSWTVFILISSIAIYMLYNIKMLTDEMKTKEVTDSTEKNDNNE